MEQYTIFCTPEQTRKALELGALITSVPLNDYLLRNRNQFPKIVIGEKIAYVTPTAEQIVGFLETKGIFVDVHKTYCFPFWYFEVCTDDKHIDSSFEGYKTHKEATLAAINVALDYLIQNKK